MLVLSYTLEWLKAIETIGNSFQNCKILIVIYHALTKMNISCFAFKHKHHWILQLVCKLLHFLYIYHYASNTTSLSYINWTYILSINVILLWESVPKDAWFENQTPCNEKLTSTLPLYIYLYLPMSPQN